MKKIILSLTFILLATVILNTGINIVNAQTTTSASSTSTQVKHKTIKTKTNKKTKSKTKVKSKKTSGVKTTLKWSASGLKLLNNFASFDYSSAIRNAYIKKVENYARRNNIKLITADVVNSMRE